MANKQNTLLCLFFLLSIGCQAAVFAVDKSANKSPKKKVVLSGRIDMLANVCASSGIVIESRQLPTIVLSVRKGSPAFYAGVTKGDKILDARLQGNYFKLVIKRKDKTYLVPLRASKDKKRVVGSGIKKQLSDYHVILLLDRSGSMTRDLGNSGRSRWYWISRQVKSLSRELQNRYRATLDLGLFNQQFAFSKKVSASKVASVIDDTITTGHTNMATPLEYVLKNYFQTRPKKPILLLIFTDGLTVDKAAVRSALRRMEQKMRTRKRTKIVLFQTGLSIEGKMFLSTLGGEQVNVQLFEKLTKTGLVSVLNKIIQ